MLPPSISCNRSVIGIRSHRIGPAETRLRKLLLEFFDPEDIYFVIDKRFGIAQATDKSVNVINFDAPQLGLRGCVDWGWRCGDFFHYALCRSVNASFYYLIEPDVWFSKKTGGALFSSTNVLDSDLLAYNISPARENWYWSRSMQDKTATVFKCAFPLTRLSRNAIDFLHIERAQMEKSFARPSSIYPNDESFVASTLCNLKEFKFTQLEKIPGLRFNLFSTMNARPIEICTDDGFIYHSALDFEDFVVKSKKILSRHDNQATMFQSFDFSFGGKPCNTNLLDQFSRSLDERCHAFFSSWRAQHCC